VRLRDRKEYPHAGRVSQSRGEYTVRWVLPTKLVATIVSNDFGSSTIRHVMASTSILSHLTLGKSFATSAAISSHITMPLRCALLLVTTVICFLGLLWAVSKAKRISRSTPCRVKIETSVAVSHFWPLCDRPPCPAYSPSEFSRTITQSRSPCSALRKGDDVPRKILVGRTFAYCWKVWQIASRKPQREMWSGTSARSSVPTLRKTQHLIHTRGTYSTEQDRIMLLELL